MQEINKILKFLEQIKKTKLNQKELLEIYDKEKIKKHSYYTHPLIKPTPCSICGNYRLDFGGNRYKCPISSHNSKLDNRLQLNI